LDVLLYLETNYLLGVATGRYEIDGLVGSTPAGARLAIPRNCFMEAFAAVETVFARRRRFSQLLTRRVDKLRSELFLARVASVVSQLRSTRLEHDLLVNDVRQRLLDAIEHLTAVAVIVEEPNDVLLASVREALAEQPTDNLILHTILRHAGENPAAAKALLTENARDFRKRDESRAALKAAGVILHGRYDSAIAWMRNTGPKPS